MAQPELDSEPLPTPFKEKLTARVAPLCQFPETILCQKSVLGLSAFQASEIYALMGDTEPNTHDLYQKAKGLLSFPLDHWPETNTPDEEGLLLASVGIFLGQDAEALRSLLRQVTGVGEAGEMREGWKKIVHPEDLNASLAAWQACLLTADPLRLEHRFLDPDGTCTDIDEQKRLQRDLEMARAEAEESNQTKSCFLANMSHEIRTPLGAILGFADLLRNNDPEPADRHQFLEIINRNGRSLPAIDKRSSDQFPQIPNVDRDPTPFCFELKHAVRTHPVRIVPRPQGYAGATLHRCPFPEIAATLPACEFREPPPWRPESEIRRCESPSSRSKFWTT